METSSSLKFVFFLFDVLLIKTYCYRRLLRILLAVLVNEIILNNFWNTLSGELAF